MQDAYDDATAIGGDGESIRKNELKRKIATTLSYTLNQLSGAAISPSEAQRLKKLIPQIWMNKKNFRGAIKDLLDQLEVARELWSLQDDASKDHLRKVAQSIAGRAQNPDGEPVE